MMSLKCSNNVNVYVLGLQTIYMLLPYLNITDLYKTHIYRSSSYEQTDIKYVSDTYPLTFCHQQVFVNGPQWHLNISLSVRLSLSRHGIHEPLSLGYLALRVNEHTSETNY